MHASEFGNRIPLEIRHQFQDLLRDSFLVPSLTHYLRSVPSLSVSHGIALKKTGQLPRCVERR